MTLKRKASYTTIISPRSASSSYNASVTPVPFMTGDVITIDEKPKHMHSRTRKRFKNDRPDKQTIYSETTRSLDFRLQPVKTDYSIDKTMQFLYSAQKQLKHCDSSVSSTPTDTDEDETMKTLPTTLDPTQLSLRKFFQPAHTSIPALSGSTANNTQKGTAYGSHFGSATSGVATSSMDVDVEMCMEIDTPGDASSASNGAQKRWVGGIGWM